MSHSRKLSATFIVLILAVAIGHLPLFRLATGQDAVATMDQAIAILDEARQRFRTVRDYECRLLNRERIRGVLLPERTMIVKVRNNPFSIYLRCEGPGPDKGVQVCYVAGRNRGMMRVHPAGLFGIFGFVSVDPHDPRALERNRHCITDAGLGTLLEGTARHWEMEKRLNKTVVRISDDVLFGRPCTRLETVHPDRSAGSFYGYRCVLWLDKATLLPAGAETYDWPRAAAQEAELLESYRYLGLRCNVGLSDAAFRH